MPREDAPVAGFHLVDRTARLLALKRDIWTTPG